MKQAKSWNHPKILHFEADSIVGFSCPSPTSQLLITETRDMVNMIYCLNNQC